MIHVPAPVPTTTPLGLTVAIDGLLLLHEPPGVLSESVTVPPTQVLDAPRIESGTEARLSVMHHVAWQPAWDV